MRRGSLKVPIVALSQKVGRDRLASAQGAPVDAQQELSGTAPRRRRLRAKCSDGGLCVLGKISCLWGAPPALLVEAVEGLELVG